MSRAGRSHDGRKLVSPLTVSMVALRILLRVVKRTLRNRLGSGTKVTGVSSSDVRLDALSRWRVLTMMIILILHPFVYHGRLVPALQQQLILA